MNIKEVENLTNMPRSNIRFYEKYGLLSINRDEQNNYREYNDQDVLILQKIKLLRYADFSLNEIKNIIKNNINISEVSRSKISDINNKISNLEIILQICTLLSEFNCTFAEIDITSPALNKNLLKKRRNIIMSEDYDSISQTYDLSRTTNTKNIDYLIREASITNKTTILDFGSGTGNHAIDIQKLTNATVYGVEPSDGMREIAIQKSSKVQFFKGSHRNIPIKDKSIDFIFMTDVLHHVSNHVSMFQEFARILKPNGSICVITESHKQIENRFWVKFFPSIVEIEKERYPDIVDIITTAKSIGFKHVKTDISDKHKKHKISENFIKIVENKGFSMFHLIPEIDYNHGLLKLKEAYANKELLEYTHGESFVWFKI